MPNDLCSKIVRINLMFFVFVLCGVYGFIFAAKIIDEVNFEEDGWQNHFIGEYQDYVKVVEYEPHSGKRALRGNLMEGRDDPITGLPGIHCPHLSYIGDNFSSKTPHEIFVRYWRRFDDALWQGSEAGHGKGEYLCDDIVDVGAYYTRVAWDNMDFALSDNGGYPADWHYEHWGYRKIYLGNNEVNIAGADGRWHKFEYYINYDENYMVFWVDGKKLYGIGSRASYVEDGKVPIYPEFHLNHVGFLYTHPQQLESSQDRSGYACGWELDDIEVWDGMPAQGDINGDGLVNISDVYLVVNAILGNATSSRADVNGDERTDVSDVYEVINEIVG